MFSSLAEFARLGASDIQGQSGGGPPPPPETVLALQFNAQFTSPVAPGPGLLNLLIFG